MTDTIAMPDQTEEVVEGCELVDFMTRRARTYGLLARIFRVEVDGKFLEELRHLKFPTSTGNEHVDYGYRTMYNYLKGTWEDTLLDLARDYARTFIGHGNNGRSAAYPFESVHTSEKRLLMQDARDEVLAIYRANLLKKGEEWNDCEDHIALELEFMQVMSERTAKALKEGKEDEAVEMLKTQRAFVGQHLANWVPMFVSDIKYFSQTDLYIGAGELLLGFVQTEVEALDDLLDGVDA
ncbi:MAG: molecular chaperone TorD family protein [Coriobacteriaceae bacterium]|nr:molecular chaperone TorD family protein [Coriobacteriaceae bacterium]MDD7111352.1 molecular chaperone TorD family protein [Coriobacteriaceae bacterium]MDY5808768.1 molecular chaperone TorD family protein [Coriobacteriales bacterium]